MTTAIHYKDLFISYGRRESLSFVGRLHRQLKLAGLDVWFDKVNIPDGEDYAARINHGIESAHNFAYVMAPRSLTSPYCLIELEYARFLGKRVIPINQIVIFHTDERKLSLSDQRVLQSFYYAYGIDDPKIRTTQQVLNRSLALIGRTDWLDAKEEMSDADCLQLEIWAKQYENFWHQHDSLPYLEKHPLPLFGKTIDPLEGVLERLQIVIQRHKDYVHTHTEVLRQALLWQRNQCATPYLAVGKERNHLEAWLLTEFWEGEQAPCQATQWVCDFVCESRKNAENMMTDVFICYDSRDQAIRDQIIHTLSRYAITTWQQDRNVQSGAAYIRAIEQGIAQASNFFFLISSHSVTSVHCQRELDYAWKYHKRIIPLLISQPPEELIPKALQELQYLPFDAQSIDLLLAVLHQDESYYEQHKTLLVQALRWITEGKKAPFLLRGHNLEHAKTWLRLHQERTSHHPTSFHREFIEASEAARGQLNTEVFISYSRKDADFARRLNLALQHAGKTTWFDQESISTGVNFETEILKGISSSDNFIFILSSDAVESEYCEREVTFATQQNKRFIPLLWREVVSLPETLRRVQWIDFKNVDFEKSFAELIEAIELDREHARHHTVFQQRAEEWEERQRHTDFLLNRTACANALKWLETSKNKQPVPTMLQRVFIETSHQVIEEAEKIERERQVRALKMERQQAERQRILTGLVSLAFVVSLAIGGYVFDQKEKIEQVLVEVKMQRVLTEGQKRRAEKALSEAEIQKRKTEAALLEAERQRQKAEKALTEVQEQKQKAEEQQRRAEENAQLARKEKGRAEKQTQIAQQQERQAFQHKRFAEQEAKVAQQERQRAEYQSTVAAIQASKAKQQTQIAQIERGRAANQSQIAQQQAMLARQKEDKAKKAEIEAQEAQSLAITSAQEAKTFAQKAEKEANRAKVNENTAIEQTLRTDSLSLVNQAGKAIYRYFYGDAVVLALKALPKPYDYKNRPPVVGQANAVLTRALSALPSQVKKLVGHESDVYFAQFSPDGHQVVTASGDKTARLWDVETGRIIRALIGHDSLVTFAQFSPDGQMIATASRDNTARLWEVKTGLEIRKLAGHQDGVNSVWFSPNGRMVVTASNDKTVRLWEVTSGREIKLFQGHDSTVYSAQFSPNGLQIVTASWDNTAQLWDIETGLLIRKLVGHKSGVYSAQFSPDSQKIITTSLDNIAQIWDVKSWQIIQTLAGHEGGIGEAQFSPDGRQVVTASYDGTARLWEVKTGQVIQTLMGHEGAVYSAQFSPDGRYVVTASSDKIARLWNIRKDDQAAIQIFRGHAGTVNFAQFNPYDQQVVTASSDNTAQLWDIEAGQVKKVQAFIGHQDDVYSAQFSPDSQQVVTASWDNTAWLWEVKTGLPIRVFKGHKDWVSSAEFSPDGQQIVTASDDGTARLWEVRSGQLIRTLNGHSSWVSSAQFSPDGQQVLTASWDKTARLWDIKTGQEILKLIGHEGGVSSAQFSPDGQTVVTSSWDRTARLWNIENGLEIGKLDGHESVVYDAQFSPDGERVITASKDRTARLWDVKSGLVIQTLVGHLDGVRSAQFSHDGQQLITASDDGTARIWKVKISSWQDTVDNAWNSTWQFFTHYQHETLLIYLLDIKDNEGLGKKSWTDQIYQMNEKWEDISLEKRKNWSYYLLTWLWEKMDIEETQEGKTIQRWDKQVNLEEFYWLIIENLGPVWQEPADFSPRYYRYCLFEVLSKEWSSWSLAQQEKLLKKFNSFQ